MDRREFKTKTGGVLRHRVVLTGDPVSAGTVEARIQAHTMLRDMLDSPDLALCGLQPFETLRMQHDGAAWTIELEAEVPGG